MKKRRSTHLHDAEYVQGDRNAHYDSEDEDDYEKLPSNRNKRMMSLKTRVETLKRGRDEHLTPHEFATLLR